LVIDGEWTNTRGNPSGSFVLGLNPCSPCIPTPWCYNTQCIRHLIAIPALALALALTACGTPRCAPSFPVSFPVQAPPLPPGLAPDPPPPPPPEFSIEWDTTDELLEFLASLNVHPPKKFLVPDAAYFSRGRVLILTDCMHISEKTLYVEYGGLCVAWRERDIFCLDIPLPGGMLPPKGVAAVDAESKEDWIDEVAEWFVEEGIAVNPDYRTPRWAQVYTPKPPPKHYQDDKQRDAVAAHGWQG
jgi:hypothetical protein